MTCQRAEEQVQAGQAEGDSSLPGSLELPHVVAPPLGFKKVMACRQEDPLPVTPLEVRLEFTQPEAVVEPAVAMMCASCVVQDEASGVTYMEMMDQNSQLTIRDITDLPKEEGDDNCL